MLRKIPVVIALSGVVEMDISDSMTSAELQGMAADFWEINTNRVSEPFVITSDLVSGDSFMYENDDILLHKAKPNGMLRVIFPLKQKD